jgi:hypothetical protein
VLQQLHIAEKEDALSPQIQFDLGWSLIAAGRYDEATGSCNKLPTDHPGRNMCLGRALGQGRTEEAIRIFTKSNARSERGFLGYAYARSGRREEAQRLAVDVSAVQQAVIFAGLGDKERAPGASGSGGCSGACSDGLDTQPSGTGSASRRSEMESSAQEGRLAGIENLSVWQVQRVFHHAQAVGRNGRSLL